MKPLRKIICLAALGLFLAATVYPQGALRYNALGQVTEPANLKLPSSKTVVTDSALAALAAPGSAVYYTGTAWALSRADAQATARVDAIVESISGTNVVLVYAGEITLSGLTAGAPYYLSATTAGSRTATPPTAAGTYRTMLCTAVSTTKALVKLSPDLVSNNLLGDADIAAEIARDAEVSAAVATEATARDTAISTAINTEVTNRNAAITSALSGVSVSALPTGSIFLWSTADIANRPSTTLLCDGNNGTVSLTGPTGASYLVVGGGTVADPSFSPVAGTYATAQSVTISTATSGASIRYTTDGSTPTSTTGTVYSTPVNVSATGTLKALAYKPLWSPSAATSAAYTITSSGPNAYFYSQPQGSGTPGTLYAQTGYTQYSTVTIGASGTATSIEIYENFGGTGNLKLALYNSSRARVAMTGAVSAGGTVGWKAGTISASVSAGTYYVAWVVDGNTMGFELNTAGTNEGRTDGSESPSYASGPVATLPANNNPPGGQPTVRVFVQ